MRWQRVFLAGLLLASACDRDRPDRFPSSIDEPATPVERPEVHPDAASDWCASHGVPESRCAPCIARRRMQLDDVGACTATTTEPTCAADGAGDADPGDASPARLPDRRPTSRGARTSR